MSNSSTIRCTRSHCDHHAVDNAALQEHLSQPHEANYRYICHIQGFGCDQVFCTAISTDEHIKICPNYRKWNGTRKYGSSMQIKRLRDMFKQSIAQLTGNAPAGPPPGFSHPKPKKGTRTKTPTNKTKRTPNIKKNTLGKRGRLEKRSLEDADETDDGDEDGEYVDTPRSQRTKTVKSDGHDRSHTKIKTSTSKEKRTPSVNKTTLGKRGRSVGDDEEAENGNENDEFVAAPRSKRTKTTKSAGDDHPATKTKQKSTKHRRQAERSNALAVDTAVTAQQGGDESNTEQGDVAPGGEAPAEQEVDANVLEDDPLEIEYRNADFFVGPEWMYDDHADQLLGMGTEITGADGKLIPGLTLAAIENADLAVEAEPSDLADDEMEDQSTQEEVGSSTSDGEEIDVEGMLSQTYRELAFETGWIYEIGY